ncbi:MAG: hypothetical protein ACM3JH_16820, partial [Acidithiobacillales bacterium]
YTVSSQSVDTFARTVTMDVPALQLVAARAPTGRTTLALGDEYYDPYIALGIVGPGLVLQGDSRNYTVDQVLRVPESGGYLRLAPEAELRNFNYTWSIVESAPGVGTVTPFGFGNEATYAAPTCPPPSRIHIQVEVADAGTGGPVGYMTKRIRVLWKDWKFTITENDHPTCYYGWEFSSGSQVEVDFSLDAHGFATNVRTIGASSSNGINTCGPIVNGCTATQTNPDPIRVNGFTASYQEASDRVFFSSDWVHMGGTSITFHCEITVPPVAPIPGTPDSFVDLPVPPFAGGVAPGSDSISSWSAELRPVRGSCP